MMARSEHYTCVIGRDDDGRIATIELRVEDLEGRTREIRVNGNHAGHIANALHEVLRDGGIRGGQWSSNTPLDLKPALGMHAELLLRAVKPLRRIDRITTIAEGIAEMSREEASYWHAQTRRRHGLKALRILIDGGVRR